MSTSRISSLATGAFVFVFLGLRALAAAQVDLSSPGTAEASLTDSKARVEQGTALVEKTCSPCGSVAVAGDDKKGSACFAAFINATSAFLAPRATCARHPRTPRDEAALHSLGGRDPQQCGR